MAAFLNGARPGGGKPDRAFLDGLRGCVLAVSAQGGTSPDIPPRFSRL
jgi:hypothetical protein